MSNSIKSSHSDWVVRVKSKCLDCGASFDDTLIKWVEWMRDMGINVEYEEHTRFKIEFYSNKQIRTTEQHDGL